MSIECGICERDLRGGHAADCPRHPGNSGTAVINGQRYKRETIKVARVELRVTPDTKAAWQAKADAAGLTLQAWIERALGRAR